MKDERPAKTTEDSSSGTSCDVEKRQVQAHCNVSKEESGSPETGIVGLRETESGEILESVYKYSERIKQFLGWKDELGSDDKTADDSEEVEEEVRKVNSDSNLEDGCIADNLSVNSSLEDIGLEIFFDDENIEIEVSSGINYPNFSNLNSENLQNEFKELDEDSRNLNAEEDSEIDKSNLVTFGGTLEEEMKPEKMNEILVQEKGKIDGGVDLRDPEEILRDEINFEEKKNEDKLCSKMPETNGKIRNELSLESLTGIHNGSIGSNNIDTAGVENACLQNKAHLVENANYDLMNARKLSLGVVENVLSEAQNHVSKLLVTNSSDKAPENLNNNKMVSSKGFDIGQRQYDSVVEPEEQNKLPEHSAKCDKISEQDKFDLSEKKNGAFSSIKDTDSSTQKDFTDDIDEDTICGIGSFKPKWLQPWATSRVYLILYSIIGVFQGSYYSYLIGTLSTLEKRFAFKSKISGTIMTVDEITPLLLGVLIGYFGGKAHRPRMVAIGMLMSATCCFVSALPYFIYGPATHLATLTVHNKTEPETCLSESTKAVCDVDDRPPTLAAILFLMLGSFLKGFGNLAYYAIGLTYMDDNAKKKNTPIYFAVAFALRLLGPLLGFLMSSFFLKFNENPFDAPDYGPGDPRWIGGWWMGFLLQGVLLVICTIPISLFPRRLPGQAPPKIETSTNESLRSKFSGLFTSLKRLARNPLFVFLVLNTTMEIFGSFGHYIMLPRYMENQFRLSASDASLFSGPPGITAIMLSTITGGFLIWKYRPNARTLIAGMIIIEVIAALGYLVLMIPHCQKVEMSNFGFDDEGLILENDCNMNCNCTKGAFTPVCGPDGTTTYFSPCFAGCSGYLNSTDQNEEIFTNCSCVIHPKGKKLQATKEGICNVENCWPQALIYIIVLPILFGITSILRVAHTMILLRSINPEDKSVALGTFETLISLFGFIPYPVTFGALVDSACLIWEKSCGETGNCWFYDVEKFNNLLHGASALFCSLSALSLVAIYFLNKRVHNLYEDHEDDVEVKGKIESISKNSTSTTVTKL